MNTVPQPIKTIRSEKPCLFEEKPRKPVLLIPMMAPVIPMEDELVHTSERPFCSDETCPCHRDYLLWQEHIGSPVRDGLMTYAEGKRLFMGQQI